jgi:hypothetical protein
LSFLGLFLGSFQRPFGGLVSGIVRNREAIVIRISRSCNKPRNKESKNG